MNSGFMLQRLLATLRAIDRWWFGMGTATALAMTRVGVGAVALLNIASLHAIQPYFLWESGFLPSRYQPPWAARSVFTLFAGGTSPLHYTGSLYLLAFFATSLIIGFFSRVSLCVVALGLVSLHYRVPWIFHGGDALLRLALLFLLFAPLGETLSVDCWLKRRRWTSERLIRLWPQRIIVYQLALMYFCTVLEKLASVSWRNGTAVYYVLNSPPYSRFTVPEFLTWQPFSTLMTYGTIGIESSLAVAAFNARVRRYAIPLGILFHLSIAFGMNVAYFSITTLALYPSYFRGEELQQIFFEVRRRVEAGICRLHYSREVARREDRRSRPVL